MSEFRLERDSMGEVHVPADAKWRAQTQRAVDNFPISGMRLEPALIAALARIKGAVASVKRELEMIEFERRWWKYAGSKEQAIRELFDMSDTRYYQLLNALIDRPEALVHDPMLVKRLRRLRQSRQRARSARRFGVQS